MAEYIFRFIKTVRYLGLITEAVVLGRKILLVGCKRVKTKNWYKVEPSSLTLYAVDIARVIYLMENLIFSLRNMGDNFPKKRGEMDHGHLQTMRKLSYLELDKS